MGYDLDTYFIEKPHETSPRRLYSQTGATIVCSAPGNKWMPWTWGHWSFMPGPISAM